MVEWKDVKFLRLGHTLIVNLKDHRPRSKKGAGAYVFKTVRRTRPKAEDAADEPKVRTHERREDAPFKNVGVSRKKSQPEGAGHLSPEASETLRRSERSEEGARRGEGGTP